MKRLFLFAFTVNGAELCLSLMEKLTHESFLCTAFAPESLGGKKPFRPILTSLTEQVGEIFYEADAIIFISACGIAVRSIAPHIRSKVSDPAVIVMDEQAEHVISLLSGHIGGGNDLTRFIAGLTGAAPVITTATDNNNVFAVDSWAAKHGLFIPEPDKIKDISGTLLKGGNVLVSSEFLLPCLLPDGLIPCRSDSKKEGAGIYIGIQKGEKPLFLHLIPRIVTLGIGCKKGTKALDIEHAVFKVLDEYNLSFYAVKDIATITLKQEEQGLLEFCSLHKLPLKFYDASELNKAEGEFTSSRFVKSVTGVDSVCERAAVSGSGYGKLIIKKQVQRGVTVAAACKDWRVVFDEK